MAEPTDNQTPRSRAVLMAQNRDLLAENQELREQAQQVQQLWLTIVYAQPGHTITLQEADFHALPNRPAVTQDVDKETGEVTIRVAQYGD